MGGHEVAMSVTSGSLRDMFGRSERHNKDDDEESLKWAAIERLPTYERMRKGMLGRMGSDGRVVHDEVNVNKLRVEDKNSLMENILKLVEDDNEGFLKKLRGRIDRVGIQIPTIEVRYEHLSVEGSVYVGKRALPTLLNATLNVIESIVGLIGLSPSKKRKIQILKDTSGIIKPSRLTLLLGPPAAGKSTLLKAFAGKLDKDLRVRGKVTYCGHELKEFVPQRTSAYIAQHNILYGEMTVRETIDFSGRCLGVGTRYEMLAEVSRREKEAGIKPDFEIDAFMKSISVSGQKTSLLTDYILKILGLDICADTIAGNEMMRGISGGEKKRLTTGEMLAGPARALFVDELSTGLDSSTTFQIVKFMRQITHIMDLTMVVSLLQPAPETYNLFDDVILLSEGEIVFQGPREEVLNFFEYMGFKCPDRKNVADFLQEVISKNDQRQYWFRKDQQYIYVPVSDFSQAFKSFHVGKILNADFNIPYDKSKAQPTALVKERFSMQKWEIFKACFDNEWLLMKRNGFLYIFKTVQITIMAVACSTMFLRTTMKSGTLKDGQKFFGALFFGLVNVMFNGMVELAMMVLRLPVFYKQRDALFFPSWAFGLPIWILTIPVSFTESAIWLIFTYYMVGFAPSFSRFCRQFLAFFFVHQMGLALFRFIAALARSPVIANTCATFILLFILVLGGFVVAKDDIQPFMIWGYYASPLMYAQNAIAMNEFLDIRWNMPNTDPRIDAPTIGKVLLKARGFFTDDYMYWVCVAALFAFSCLFNFLFIVALTYVDPLRGSKAILLDNNDNDNEMRNRSPGKLSSQELWANSSGSNSGIGASDHAPTRGMVLPFRPLSLAFNHISYEVDMPSKMKMQGVEENRLRLLRDVSGTFRPGILTALVGVTGAGKTTLMDVLAGRKTGGWIEGSISISGYPKNQTTFARVCGYCEQTDIHSPYVTVYESVLYSAWLRLSSDVDAKTRKMFVKEVMDLVELHPIRNSLVGLPGVDGLSTEQRKRLTIAVELVANPSIIFMDEPTSGLDARAAAIVMRTVRNTGDTGRTVVCTIHQPSIDIFEAFDELLLMKRGGRIIYAGTLGRNSNNLIEYFEGVPGVPKIKEGYNPATWMLDISEPTAEASLRVDFAEVYANSSLYKRNQELVQELSTPREGSKDLFLETVYSQPLMTQFKACFWKQFLSYWRNPQYNLTRLLLVIIMGLLLGLIFWDKGQMITKVQDLLNLLGATFITVFFLGGTNANAVQPIVTTERTVFYREKAAGMYSPLPYALAQVAVEVIYVSIQTLVYCVLVYSMIGFEWKIEKVLWFYYIMTMCLTYLTLYGMMLVAVTPGIQIAAVVMSFLLSFWNLTAGFVVPRPMIPIWWRWYYWCSPISWTLYGLITSQVGDKDTLVFVPGEGNMAVKQYLRGYMGYDHDFLPVVAVAHFAWVVLFFTAFVFGIKYLNFQKR